VVSPNKIAILGAGESGTGAALLAKRKGMDVFVSDRGSIKPEYRRVLESEGIAYEEGTHTESRLFEADILVKSPGIPDTAPLVRSLRAAGKEIVDEIEFASRFVQGRIIAITGTNGKTTTTRLTWHLLREGGLDAALGGNIGTSFAALAAERDHDYFVLEVSSFQLDNCTTLRPFISAITNITPDHLDRYGYEMARYVDAKFRILQQQQPGDHFIFHAENATIAQRLENYTGPGSPRRWPLRNASFETETELVLGSLRVPKNKLQLRGRHNYLNIACAVTAAQLAGVADEAILRGLRSFTADPHRMEPCGTVDGVEYLNDSKATNVDSVFYALEAMAKPTIWIAGGQDKGNDYSALLPLVPGRVKALICLTAHPEKLHEAFSSSVPVIRDAGSAEEAVRLAAQLAVPGDVVLLSPACASFDLFQHYMDRGDRFKDAVNQLIHQTPNRP
jgi:UDP-N-acetylmuramoylalanine--D-glutamate ligase